MDLARSQRKVLFTPPTLRDRVAGRILALAGKVLGENNLYSGVFQYGNDDEWSHYSFFQPTVENLISEGQKKNAAVYASLATLAFSFIEPPARLYRKGKLGKLSQVDNHLLSDLIRQPNPIMGQKELGGYIANYLGIGGNCYLVKLRGDVLGQPVQLWPYHGAQISVVPGGRQWIDHYILHLRNGEKIPIDPADIIHLRWPIPDPHYPWLGQAPLMAVAREIATDNEMTRYIQALLSNDAVPRNALSVPYKLSELQLEDLRKQWNRRHGGENRGSLAVLEGGMALNRVALDMEELAMQALRNTPEGRIAASLRVPAQVSGLNVGLEYSTYSNFEEANSALTLKTMVPLWTLVADGLERGLLPEFEGEDALSKWTVRYDLSEVMALAEDQNAKSTRIQGEYEKDIIELNEARSELGYPELTPADLQRRADEAAARMQAAQQAMSNGGQNNGDQQDDPNSTSTPPKRAPQTRRGTKGVDPDIRAIRDLIRAVTPSWKAVFAEQMQRVIARVTEGEGEKAVGDAWNTDREAEIMYKAYVDTMRPVIDAGVKSGFRKLGRSDIDYDLEGVTSRLADRVKGINATTQRVLAQEIADGLKAGFSIEQIVDGVEEAGYAGIRGVFGEIERNRAVMIARSETSVAYNTGTITVFSRSGVSRVLVSDGDYDDECAEADGQVWDAEYALNHPIAHPNCIRTFEPYEGEGE